MINYEFGAGGFKLGERVEILTTGQRGILLSETIHVSGCNTYYILLPNVLNEGRMKTTMRDHLMLRKLEAHESIFEGSITITEENSFAPKGADVNADWIRMALNDQKEFITEIDEAVGIEEIVHKPGLEVWHKVYGKIMVITHITREIYAKQLEYSAMYMSDEKECGAISHAYAFIPLQQKLNVPPADKLGSLFEDGRDNIGIKNRGFFDSLHNNS